MLQLGYINNRCDTCTGEVSDSFVYSAGIANDGYYSLPPSSMPSDALPWLISVSWVVQGQEKWWCFTATARGIWRSRVYNFFPLKMRFFAGYRHVQVICVCVKIWYFFAELTNITSITLEGEIYTIITVHQCSMLLLCDKNTKYSQ